MKKRLIALGLLLAMVLTLLPGTALAADPTEGFCGPEGHLEEVRWAYKDHVLTVSGRGPMDNFGWDWGMHAPWHAWTEQIIKFVIEEGVTAAGAYAFSGCSALETVELPAGFTEISSQSGLPYCPVLKEIRVAPGNTVFFTEDNVLYDRNTDSLLVCPAGRENPVCTVAAGTKNIGNSAFLNNKNLKKAVLPEGLESIGPYAFEGCEKLEKINAPESLQTIGMHGFEDTAFYRNPDNWTGSMLYLDDWLLKAQGYGENADLVIREGTLGLADEAIAHSYAEDSIYTVFFPQSLLHLGSRALAGCEAKEIVLPAGLMTMGEGVFDSCKKLRKVTMPPNLKVLPDSTFWFCSALESLVLPEGLEEIGVDAFRNCTALGEVHIPGTVTKTGIRAFEGCSALRDVYFGGSRKEWEALGCDTGRAEVHFAGSTDIGGTCGEHLTWTLENGVLTIEGTGKMDDFGWGTARPWEKYVGEIRKAVVKDGVTTIGSDAFGECRNLQEISLADSVTEFGDYAFFRCSSLVTLCLPAGLTELDPEIFRSCFRLASLTASPENPAYTSREGVIYSKDGSTLCCYPQGRLGSTYTLLPGTEKIQNRAFFGNPFLCAVGGDRSLRKIGSSAFDSAAGLTDFYYEGSSRDWAEAGMGDIGLNMHFLWTPGAEMPATLRAAEGANREWQNYTKWASPATAYLIPRENGALTRLAAVDGAVIAEEYDKNRELTGRRLVTVNELPIFGGFCETNGNYFLVFGASNPAESDSCEVIRTVKYDKNWNRLGDARIYGEETYKPFDAASLRMTVCGDYLYAITGREIYAIKGIHHQTSYMYRVHIPTMTAETGSSWDGCCSHSFNQFIALDGNRLVTVNHGDAYPRAVTLCRFTEDASEKEFRGRGESEDLLKISGIAGDNVTGASVGGLEVTDSSILTAGSTEDQTAAVGTAKQQNIFLISLDKKTGEKTERYLTDYEEEDQRFVGTPYLIRISDDRFAVLWTEYEEEKEYSSLYWQFTDGTGKPEGRIFRAENANMSDCRPVLSGNAITWYVLDESAPVFYSIPLDHPETLQILRVENNSMTGVTRTVCGGGSGCPSRKFTDAPAPDHWAHEGVDFAVSHRLFGGMSETTFEPDTPMTRAMLVTVLWRYEGEPHEGTNIFTDVPGGQWFTEAIAWAAHNGVVGGVGEGKFDPDGNVTREQMAAILCRYAEKKGFDVSKRADLTGFPDENRISRDWALEPLQWAVAEKLIGGSDGWLLPQGSATRAQVATILMRFIKNTAEA